MISFSRPNLLFFRVYFFFVSAALCTHASFAAHPFWFRQTHSLTNKPIHDTMLLWASFLVFLLCELPCVCGMFLIRDMCVSFHCLSFFLLYAAIPSANGQFSRTTFLCGRNDRSRDGLLSGWNGSGLRRLLFYPRWILLDRVPARSEECRKRNWVRIWKRWTMRSPLW